MFYIFLKNVSPTGGPLVGRPGVANSDTIAKLRGCPHLRFGETPRNARALDPCCSCLNAMELTCFKRTARYIGQHQKTGTRVIGTFLHNERSPRTGSVAIKRTIRRHAMESAISLAPSHWWSHFHTGHATHWLRETLCWSFFGRGTQLFRELDVKNDVFGQFPGVAPKDHQGPTSYAFQGM